MSLGFNSNFMTQRDTSSFMSSNRDSSGGQPFARGDNQSETAGALANNMVDAFINSNPFASEIDYTQFANVPETAGSLAFGAETAGSLAFGSETAGSLAFGTETAGSLAFGGAETAVSIASSGGDSGFVA